METRYGWKCPQCNVIHAPSIGKCPTCSPYTTTVTGGTFMGYAGTVTISSQWPSSFFGSGTAYYSPPKTESSRAHEIVDKWVHDGNSVKQLIDAAVQVLIDRAADEDEEEDE